MDLSMVVSVMSRARNWLINKRASSTDWFSDADLIPFIISVVPRIDVGLNFKQKKIIGLIEKHASRAIYELAKSSRVCRIGARGDEGLCFWDDEEATKLKVTNDKAVSVML
jgi:hypothetical protein